MEDTLIPEPNLLSDLYVNHPLVRNDRKIRKGFLIYTLVSLVFSNNLNSDDYKIKKATLRAIISIYHSDKYIFTDARIEVIKKIAARDDNMMDTSSTLWMLVQYLL